MRLIDCHVTAHLSYSPTLTSKEDILFNAKFTFGGGRTLKSRWYRYVRSVFPKGGCRDAQIKGGNQGALSQGADQGGDSDRGGPETQPGVEENVAGERELGSGMLFRGGLETELCPQGVAIAEGARFSRPTSPSAPSQPESPNNNPCLSSPRSNPRSPSPVTLLQRDFSSSLRPISPEDSPQEARALRVFSGQSPSLAPSVLFKNHRPTDSSPNPRHPGGSPDRLSQAESSSTGDSTRRPQLWANC